MNIQAKIVIPLLFLVATGCVHHPRRYSAYSNEYEYSRGYDSYYYNDPIYYDRHVYVNQPIVKSYRQGQHQHREQPRYTTTPSKHQKSRPPRYESRAYQPSSRSKHTKRVVSQPRYDRHEGKVKSYKRSKSDSFKQYQKTYKGSKNSSYSNNRQGTDFSNQRSMSRPYRESKHRKMYNNRSTQKFPMGKSFKR